MDLALHAITTESSIPPDPPDAPSSGTTPPSSIRPRIKYFGDYELIEEIARGGMGVVWKARQASLNRPVAIKMILSGEFATEARIKRFRAEAEAAANLQHPNIVAIHEVGDYDGQHYFSMDYIEGNNLADLTRCGPWPAAKAAALVKKIAEAIHYAHQRGTLHRDLKPSNVLIDSDGQPRITDFGLAKQLTRESGLTQSGAVLGTPSYMPPEQASGQNDRVGPASDVYSIGAVLYQLLTGRAPFLAEVPLATLRKVMDDEPVSPSRLNHKTPPDLETICLKCLEKRPEHRYATARQLVEELDRFLNHEPILARTASPWRKAWSWWQRRPWAIVGLAAITGTILLGLAYGLWEKVQYLQWQNHQPGARVTDDLGRFFSTVLYAGSSGLLFLVGVVLYYQFLKYRRRCNVATGSAQTALLALGGLALVAIGLGINMYVIRTFIWTRLAPSYTFAGICLGTPLLLCWFGGIFVLQALRWRQALWSGVTSTDELFESRPLKSNATGFAVALSANLALFVALSFAAIPTGTYPEFPGSFDAIEKLPLPPNIPYGLTDGPKLVPMYSMIRIGFCLVAFGVSLAPRLIAARNMIPIPLSIFYWLFLIGGTALTHLHFLPGKAYVTAVLAGLAGGWVLQKAAKLRMAEATDQQRVVRARELFQWDARVFVKTLVGLSASCVLLAGLLFRWNAEQALNFLFFSGLNALWPIVILACRTTRGDWRAAFLWLIPLTVFATIYPIASAMAGFSSARIMPATIPAGIVIGCMLIRFAKIAVKTPQPRV